MTITHRANTQTGYSRDAWLEINLQALEDNYYNIKKHLSSNTKLMAVVKSDAYGHGAGVISPILEACGTNYFGVASIDEGIDLRNAGIKSDILVLSPTPQWAYKRAIENNLQISISSLQQLKQLEEYINSSNIKNTVNIQVFINTGMNREGCALYQASELIDYIINSQNNIINLAGVFSHLAFAASHEYSKIQLNNFYSIINQYKDKNLGLIHIGASSSITKSEYHLDMVRTGIALYGLECSVPDLRQIISLYARSTLIQKVKTDDGSGYSHLWTAPKDTSLALLPLGYADGVKRNLSNNIQVYSPANNKYYKQAGNISMDQLSIDLDCIENIPDTGNIYELLGENIPVSQWSSILNTIDYEIICNLRMRLSRVYTRK